VDLLKKLKHKAHVVLSNGAPEMDRKTKKLKEIDENKEVRKEIRAAGVDVRDRIFQSSTGGVTPHLGHNKFLVVCDKQGVPEFVWTGSTNWTTSGLCTQMNNALVLRDKDIAKQFRAQWDVLAKASTKVPAQYPPGGKANQWPLPAPTAIGNAQVRATFTPWKAPSAPKAIDVKAHTPGDLAYCVDLINNAQESLLFLMFIPGPNGTLLEAIQARNGTSGGRSLFVRGVANEDPGATAKVPSIALAHRGELIPVPFDVVFPARVDMPNTFWLTELLKMPGAHAMIHSKIVVIDPFGKKPAVITGSHNQGFKASTANDENLVIIEGNADLAQQYAINIVTVFNQYWWRYNQMPAEQKQSVKGNKFAKGNLPKTTTAPTTVWKGLVHAQDWKRWQTGYLPDGDKRYELDFWFGRPMTVSKYVPPNNPRPPAKPKPGGAKKKPGGAKKKPGAKKRPGGAKKKRGGAKKKRGGAKKKPGGRKKVARK
jgi:phosphatidylserine/phosphatidylglycerophosphate/cardiolipin synthase-like enzyme